MFQNILVLTILIFTIGYTVHTVIKSIRKKNTGHCGDCKGCDIKKLKGHC
jgi:hypothetical protein